MKNIITMFIVVLVFAGACTQKKKIPIPLINIAQNPGQSGGGSSSNENVTGSSTSTSSSTQNNTSSSSTSTTSSTSTSLSSVTPTVTVTEVDSSSINFTYQTTSSITVSGLVVDQNDNPVSGALVEFLDASGNSLLSQISSTNPSGQVSGNLVVSTNDTTIYVRVTYNGQTTQTGAITIKRTVSNNVKVVISIGNIKLPIVIGSSGSGSSTGTTVAIADADNDGVPDSSDAFPNDATRAFITRFPTSGVYTVSYEDGYSTNQSASPDYDLNDYTIQFFNQEITDANGKIKEIRGNYQHVAKCAGYTHTLNIRMPISTDITYTKDVYDANGNTISGQSVNTAYTSGTAKSLNILPSSGTTISSGNCTSNATYAQGYISKIKIVFTSSISRSALSMDAASLPQTNKINNVTVVTVSGATTAPYDLYAYVNNTSMEIHFPGIYANSDATNPDLFVNNSGFVWAVLVPGTWGWPVPDGADIRNAANGYPNFTTWMSSSGASNTDWYLYPTSGKVFPVPSSPSSNLLAYLQGVETSYGLTIALILIAIGVSIGLFIMRKKSIQAT